MGSLRKLTTHRNSGTKTAIESWRNLPRLVGGVSVTSDVFPVNHSNSIVPPTATSSSQAPSVSAPVVISCQQVLVPLIFHMDVILKFRYLLVTLLLRMYLPAYHFYLLQEVPLSSHHPKLYRFMETSCHLSLDSQGRRTRPNQELFLIG